MRLLATFFVSLFLASCASREPMVGRPVAALTLAGADGRSYSLPSRDGDAVLTVLVFSSWHCLCQDAHDARLRTLDAAYRARGVAFFAVDAETGGTVEHDAAEARARGYGFPVLLDPGGGLARSLGAEYATEAFVLDRWGVVRYHGGLDTDRKTLHDNAVPLLGNALDDLLAQRPVRSAETKPLGCALRVW